MEAVEYQRFIDDLVAWAGLFENPSWLPDAERIMLWHNEIVDGRAAVHNDGHLIELAVFEAADVPSLSAHAAPTLADNNCPLARGGQAQ
ncbi:MAG: hypothetical protein HHJ11_15365, partial [Phycicoccus sp.]|nr:hypothetical protein [Phycicoccus sp.]